jgi:hypothetical protein
MEMGRNRDQGPVRVRFTFILSILFSNPIQIQTHVSNSQFSRVKNNLNMNIISIVYNINIYYFPYYLFMEEINDLIKIPFSIISFYVFI